MVFERVAERLEPCLPPLPPSCTCRPIQFRTPLDLRHLTALTRLHTSGKKVPPPGGAFSSGPQGPLEGVHLVQQDLLPPNLVSLCVASCEASLTPLLALTSLQQLSLDRLPARLPTRKPGGDAGSNTSASGQGSPAQMIQTGRTVAEKLQQLREHLPGVEIKLTKAGNAHHQVRNPALQLLLQHASRANRLG